MEPAPCKAPATETAASRGSPRRRRGAASVSSQGSDAKGMTQVPFSSPRSSAAAPTFREARDLLLHYSDDYHGARAAFGWPRPERVNWALDWFDAELGGGGRGRPPPL